MWFLALTAQALPRMTGLYIVCKYQLSLKLYYLSHAHSPLDQLSEAARGPMQDLANELRQSCHLSIIYDRRLMVVRIGQ